MRRGSGFSLLELLVVIAIAGIVVGIAIPSYRSFVRSAERSEAATSLYAALMRARSEAIKRNRLVIVCRRDFFASGARCDTDADGSWDEGWIVFVPADGAWSGTEPAAGDALLLLADPVGGSVDITPQLADPAWLGFSAAGRPLETAVFTICVSGSSDGREVRVMPSGQLLLRETGTCPG